MYPDELVGHVVTMRDKQAWLMMCPRRSWLRLAGSDRLRFLQNMTTADVGALQPGQTAQGVFVNQRGLVLDWVEFWAHDGAVEVLTGPSRVDKLFEWLDRYLIADDVTLTQTGGELSVVLIGGEALAEALSEDVAAGQWPKPGSHVVLDLGGVPCGIAPLAGLPDKTYWVRVATTQTAALTGYLKARGVQRETSERFRLRCLTWGVPGGEYLTLLDANPWELRLDAAVAVTKGCYLGQEVVTRLKSYDKVQRHLMGFVSNTPLSTGTPLVTETSDNAGHVLVSASDPDTHQVFGLALVRRRYAAPETRLVVQNGSAATPIVLVDCPFWE
jgi:folate-binding protein YgfZ